MERVNQFHSHFMDWYSLNTYPWGRQRGSDVGRSWVSQRRLQPFCLLQRTQPRPRQPQTNTGRTSWSAKKTISRRINTVSQDAYRAWVPSHTHGITSSASGGQETVYIFRLIDFNDQYNGIGFQIWIEWLAYRFWLCTKMRFDDLVCLTHNYKGTLITDLQT